LSDFRQEEQGHHGDGGDDDGMEAFRGQTAVTHSRRIPFQGRDGDMG